MIRNQYNLGNVLDAYDHTHFCIHVRPKFKKRRKKKYSARQTPGATDLKHCIHTQLDFGNNMGRNPPGYTSSH